MDERRSFKADEGLSPDDEPPWVGHEEELIGVLIVGARRATALGRRARSLGPRERAVAGRKAAAG